MILKYPIKGTYYKTLTYKQNIPIYSFVECVNINSDDILIIYCKYKDTINSYLENELQELAISINNKYPNHIIEINNDDNNYIDGTLHLTKNIRININKYKLFHDYLYTGYIVEGSIYDYYKCYSYEYNVFSDEEITDILLNEIVYRNEPMLQYSSNLVQRNRGLDKDLNSYHGHYILPNNNVYTIIKKQSIIIIREGYDNGWSDNNITTNRTIYENKIDWYRYKISLIKYDIKLNQFKNPTFIENNPSITNLIYKNLKNNILYKLSWEI